MALCFVKETDRHGNEVSQIPMRRFDEPAAMARALLEYDFATWVPFMGSFGSLDTHGFAESEPCDNTFTSHEDYSFLPDCDWMHFRDDGLEAIFDFQVDRGFEATFSL